MKKSALFLGLSLLTLGACKKDLTNTPDVVPATQSDNPVVNFDFNQHETWTGKVTVSGYDGPLAQMPLTLMNGEQIVQTGFTDANGEWKLTLNHTPSMQLALVSEIPTLQGTFPILDNGFNIAISPDTYVPTSATTSSKSEQTTTSFRGNTRWYDDRNYTYEPSRDKQWLPAMEAADVLTNAFLTYITNSVPEQYPVAVHNPSLLANGTTSLRLDSAGDVFMTYVDEGAGYKNAIGYFTWTDGNEPTSVNDIDTIWTAFENFSGRYSGGGLQAGDKIYLGSYPAGTNIGFALIANGYDGHSANFKQPFYTYYSIPSLNPEWTAEKRRHNILLHDSQTDRFVIGFEDLNRDSRSDDDFNDALFFVTANPPAAIDTTGVTPIVTQLDDCDFDGVPDVADVAPCDNRYASLYTTTGRFMFEDMYPYKGDYDFNDVVVDYTAVAWKHADGTTNKMEFTFTQKADGGSYENGIAFAIDGLDAMMVSNVTFGNASSYYEDESQAVFVLANVSEWANQEFVNTYAHQAAVSDYLTYTVSFEINGASTGDVFWGENLDAFIFQLGQGGVRNEIHTKYKQPTAKADSSKIGQGDDITLLEAVNFNGSMWSTANNATLYWATQQSGNTFTLEASGVTYSDENGFPWALHMDSEVKHPFESIDIRQAYTGFSGWVESEGLVNTQWFTTPTAGKVKE